MLRHTKVASQLSSAASRLTQSRGLLSVTLPDLPYDYSALEPHISGEIMELHHKKHHQTYVTNFNKTEEQYEAAESKGELSKLIALQSPLKFNGGGHVNHSIFWTNLIPAKDAEPPSGDLAAAINEEFGSLEAFKEKFNAAAAGVQGSGWGWLGVHKDAGRLIIETTANQDPLSTKGLVPVLGCDVWEHAFYLQYQNRKPDYLKEFWKVVNWKNVGDRFAAAAHA